MAFVEIRGADPVQVKISHIKEGLGDTSKLMGEIGNYLKAAILMRTSSGKDVEGLPFEPYSRSYAAVRAEKGLPTGRVDLFFTGRMLGSMTYEEEKHQVRLFFMSTPRSDSKASNAAIAFYNNEVREFFSISSTEQKAVLNLVKSYIDDLSKGS